MNDTTREPQDTIPDGLMPYSDAELDDAMRELEAIEAGERDALVIRQLHRRTLPLGTLAAWLTAVAITLLPALASADDAPPKPKRPVMCMVGQPVSGQGFAGYLCLDGKRPRIFTRYIVVEFVDENGKPRTYTLGWTAPVKRASKGGYVAEGTPLGGMKL